MQARSIPSLLKQAGSEWVDDNAMSMAAALAYYAMFSLAPLLVLAIGIAGLIFGHNAARNDAMTQIQHVVGDQGGKAIKDMVEAASKPSSGLLGSVLGFIMLAFGATSLFVQLQSSLNTIWGVMPKPGQAVWGVLRQRSLSFVLVLGIAFLILVSFLISAALAAASHFFGGWVTGVAGHAANSGVSFLVFTLLFAMIFRLLPDAKIAWGDVWLGAVITSLLFVIGKFVIGLYVGHSAIASSYGAAGSLALVLVWVYYSSLIFLFGAELTKVYADKYGSRIVPAAHAQALTEEARARQGIPPTVAPTEQSTPPEPRAQPRKSSSLA